MEVTITLSPKTLALKTALLAIIAIDDTDETIDVLEKAYDESIIDDFMVSNNYI